MTVVQDYMLGIPAVAAVQEELVVQDQIYQMVVPVYFFLQ